MWDYQNLPQGSGDAGMENYDWWVSGDKNTGGCKTEHISSDPRDGVRGTTSYIQGSTCGYFGHVYLDGVKKALEAAACDFPAYFGAHYHVYQGDKDVTALVKVGGKGQDQDLKVGGKGMVGQRRPHGIRPLPRGFHHETPTAQRGEAIDLEVLPIGDRLSNGRAEWKDMEKEIDLRIIKKNFGIAFNDCNKI